MHKSLTDEKRYWLAEDTSSSSVARSWMSSLSSCSCRADDTKVMSDQGGHVSPCLKHNSVLLQLCCLNYRQAILLALSVSMWVTRAPIYPGLRCLVAKSSLLPVVSAAPNSRSDSAARWPAELDTHRISFSQFKVSFICFSLLIILLYVAKMHCQLSFHQLNWDWYLHAAYNLGNK